MLCMTKFIKTPLCCILIALNLIFAVNFTVTDARADERTYAMTDEKNLTYICSSKSSATALFAVPYTYCVEIISNDGEWYYVKYGGESDGYRPVYGYCLKENLTVLSVPPQNVFLIKHVKVNFCQQSGSPSLPTVTDITVNAAYYGVYYQAGMAYSYVYYNNSFGYVQGANDDYPRNTLPASGDGFTPPEQTEKPAKKESSVKLTVAIILTALAIVCLSLLYFTGKRKKFFGKKP